MADSAVDTADSFSGLLHAGLAGSFVNLPYVAPDSALLRDKGAQAAIYGIPFDSTSISRTGANYGPRGIREVSCQFSTYSATLDFDISHALSPVDCGDCAVVPGNAAKTFESAQRDISEILKAGALPVIFGGDHSITIPAVRAAAQHVERLGMVVIDTHFDTAQEVAGEELNHCTEIVRAVDAGVDPKHIVLVGHNGWANPRSELDFIRRTGITVIWGDEVWERRASEVAQQALEIAGSETDGIYLSLDIDAIDAAYAPGNSMPTPGGLTSREAIDLVRGISAKGLVAFDLNEVSPGMDPASRMTSILATRLTLEAMAFHAGASLTRK